MRKFTGSDTAAFGYYSSHVSSKTMTPSRQYPAGGKKKTPVTSPGDWKLFNDWIVSLELEAVEAEDYEAATSRLRAIVEAAGG